MAVKTAPEWPFRLLSLLALYARYSLRSRVSPAGREACLRRLSPGERESAKADFAVAGAAIQARLQPPARLPLDP